MPLLQQNTRRHLNDHELYLQEKSPKSVATETVTSSNKNFQTFCGDTHNYKSPLCDSDFLHKFLQCLHNSKQLDDFNKLVQNLCDGPISLHNLAWKSTLQIGRYFSCSTMTLMRYDPECVDRVAMAQGKQGI